MEKKYAVNDFMNGRIVSVDTQEEAIQLFWENVLKFIKLQYGNIMYFEIEQNNNLYTFKNQNAELLSEQPLTMEEILALFNTGEIPISIKPSIPATSEINLGN